MRLITRIALLGAALALAAFPQTVTPPNTGGGGGGVGCTVSGSAGQLVVNDGSTGCSSVADYVFTTHTMAVGAAGIFDLHSAATSALKVPGGFATGLLHVTTTTGATAGGLLVNADITNATIDLTAKVTGLLPSANGGTGVNNTATLTLGSSNQNWASLGTGIVKNTTTTGALSSATSGDILGLCTTCVVASSPGVGLAHFAGSTQTATSSLVVNADITAGTIDLTTKVTGILPTANGGTANAFFAVSGPATSAKTFTFPNASATVLTSNAVVTAVQGGTGVANTATHTLGSSNQNWATLGTGIVKNTTTTGAISDAVSADVYGLWSGSCSSSTFLRGDGACATPAGSGTVTVSGAGSLTSTAFMTGAGTTVSQTPSATSTLDSSGNAVFAGTVTSGSGSGVAGGYQFLQGTASTPAANSIVLQAPTSVSTAYSMAFPSAAGTGFMLNTDSSNVDAITFVGFSGTGNVLRAASPTTTGTFTAAAITASGAFTNNGSYAGSAVVPTANIAVALANQTSIHGITASTAAGDAVLGQIIAHGSTALDFASTTTGACATVITATATGADATKDIIFMSTNASIKAVTGYVPASTGGFSINPFITTNTANFEACNWTAGTVDPGSITVLWVVMRFN